MGTNYYLHQKPACECCGRPYDPLHIGKSSGGWCFSLHVMPDDGISTLDDWRIRWNEPGAYILNEYGDRVSVEDMERTITDRNQVRNHADKFDTQEWWGNSYHSEQHFHERNHSERGPNGLLRHRIDEYCIGHGDGTFDYIVGEFS